MYILVYTEHVLCCLVVISSSLLTETLWDTSTLEELLEIYIFNRTGYFRVHINVVKALERWSFPFFLIFSSPFLIVFHIGLGLWLACYIVELNKCGCGDCGWKDCIDFGMADLCVTTKWLINERGRVKLSFACMATSVFLLGGRTFREKSDYTKLMQAQWWSPPKCSWVCGCGLK